MVTNVQSAGNRQAFSNSQVIGCEDRLRNDLLYTVSGRALNSIQSNRQVFVVYQSVSKRIGDDSSCVCLGQQQLSLPSSPSSPPSLPFLPFLLPSLPSSLPLEVGPLKLS